MAKIPFKVSARTARLIGRENIASSKGAIIELVKNSYDADSLFCIVYFDNKYSTIPEQVSENEYEAFLKKGIEQSLLEQVYAKNKLKDKIDNSTKLAFKKALNKLNALFIIDAGEGMTEKIINDYWMTIGTDNKATDIFTNSGRIKAGSKGIGRFALDKLGSKCTMITKFNPQKHNYNDTKYQGYLWNVNWSDFEGDFKTIDTVNAELTGLSKINFKENILNKRDHPKLTTILNEYNCEYGTILEITDLRENWEDFFVDQMFTDLEVLVPPKESGKFDIFLFSADAPQKYGEITGSICDDYDYKLIAKADTQQNVEITVYRNEYDIETIDPTIFKRDNMCKSPYKKEDFEKGFWKTTKTFSQLIPGFKNIDEEETFEGIGIFDFTLYFLKKTYSSDDLEKYCYRPFNAKERKDWLDKFGGIKLFRDSFRTRPYGEAKNPSFDWLGLGARKAQSPAGIAKIEGGYKVNPDNVTGAINISRLTNVNFEDKSSREGLQENKTFQIFKQLIAGIINILEQDRAYIAREMSEFYKEKFSDEINEERLEKVVKDILDKRRKEQDSHEKSNDTDNELFLLAEKTIQDKEKIERMEDEQKVLRGMASSGIVIASFTHELSNLSDVLSTRLSELKDMVASKISPDEFIGTPDYLNPFIMMEYMRKQDIKLQNWLKFSIGAARKDKRKRKKILLQSYLENYKNDWNVILINREIKMQIEKLTHNDIEMKIFEIDLDSILNNLIVNSIDAFIKQKGDRIITIRLNESPKELAIEYYDNGPGLSNDIDDPEKIFQPLFTTKRHQHTGEEIGTGLGMWLVKSIVKDYDGTVKLLFPQKGFGLRVIFPKKLVMVEK